MIECRANYSTCPGKSLQAWRRNRWHNVPLTSSSLPARCSWPRPRAMRKRPKQRKWRILDADHVSFPNRTRQLRKASLAARGKSRPDKDPTVGFSWQHKYGNLSLGIAIYWPYSIMLKWRWEKGLCAGIWQRGQLTGFSAIGVSR